MATTGKSVFDGQSVEEFFASFAYKRGGGGHDEGIRKRNSSGGGGERVDKRIGQGRGLLSPNNNKNNNNNDTPPPPSPLPSSSLQSTTYRKKTSMTRPPSIFNGLSPAEFVASFAYKGKRVDNIIRNGEDFLNPGTPPAPSPVKNRKRRKTASAATTTTVRRVSRFFPPPAGRVVVVDVKKDIAGKGKDRSGGRTTRKRPRTTGNTGSTDVNRRPQKRSNGRRRRSIRLSAEEMYSDVYRRVSDHDIWDAPLSSQNLLQERHCFDPWRVLVICILLNVTNGDQVRKVLPGFFLLCPDAKSVKEDLKEQMVDKLHSLGLQRKRAKLIIDFSERYLADGWTHVTQLPGIGKYAADAYAIFAAGKLEQVKPQDHKLVDYWKEVSDMLCRNS